MEVQKGRPETTKGSAQGLQEGRRQGRGLDVRPEDGNLKDVGIALVLGVLIFVAFYLAFGAR